MMIETDEQLLTEIQLEYEVQRNKFTKMAGGFTLMRMGLGAVANRIEEEYDDFSDKEKIDADNALVGSMSAVEFCGEQLAKEQKMMCAQRELLGLSDVSEMHYDDAASIVIKEMMGG